MVIPNGRRQRNFKPTHYKGKERNQAEGKTARSKAKDRLNEFKQG